MGLNLTLPNITFPKGLTFQGIRQERQNVKIKPSSKDFEWRR